MSFFRKIFGLPAKTKVGTEENIESPVTIPIEIKITTSYGTSSAGTSSTSEPRKFDPIEQNGNLGWRLNSGAGFPLTLLHIGEDIAQQVRSILDEAITGGAMIEDKLLGFFATHNLKVKEIEEYKQKYRSVYHRTIEDLKKSSPEWGNSSPMDREDLLSAFREKALDKLYERAECDLDILFDNEPSDITIDDVLINEYGFETFHVYVRFAYRIDKIQIVTNENSYRPIFEKMVELGLAARGPEIPRVEVLATLTLKELNALADNKEKEYKRKNAAIEYIMGLPDLEVRIGNYIALRQLFKLKPLPEKYKHINIRQIADTWAYHNQEVRLLISTFRNSWYAWRDMKDDKYVTAYKIDPLNKMLPCPCALDMAQKSFPKDNPPRIPFHVGCDCFLRKEFKY